MNFPGLPAGYWTAEALSKVASVIGSPMYTDRYTFDLNKISYAQVLVKVDITKSLLETIDIEPLQVLSSNKLLMTGSQIST